jgi:hypothetical protein
MNVYNAIGGYFELELGGGSYIFHESALPVNSGRNALELILRCQHVECLHLPYYGCDALYHTAQKAGLKTVFYTLDEEFNPKIDLLKPGEALLFINYFGILQNRVSQLTDKCFPMIIDNCQAFFSEHTGCLASFYSPRKFFGVPDGGFAYVNQAENYHLSLEMDHSIDRLTHLVRRLEENPEAGYVEYKKNEAAISNMPVKRMSLLTSRLLRSINYDEIRAKRNQNFLHLHSRLRFDNELSALIGESPLNGPLVYPYLNADNNGKRDALLKKRIYIARYWPNQVPRMAGQNLYETHLQQNLLALPIDQRYTETDMGQILDALKK